MRPESLVALVLAGAALCVSLAAILLVAVL